MYPFFGDGIHCLSNVIIAGFVLQNETGTDPMR